jgi:integrase
MARGAVGVRRRGAIYWLFTPVPKDLQEAYGRTRIQESLQTADPREANLKGTRRRTELLEEFETKRKALNPQSLEVITSELAQVLADGARRRVLQEDQARREGSDPILNALSQIAHSKLPFMRNPDGSITLPERDPLDGRTEWEILSLEILNSTQSQETAQDLARMNLRSVLPLLQADAQAMGFTITRKTAGLKEALHAYLAAYRRGWQEATQRDAGELIEVDSTPPLTHTSKTATGTLATCKSLPKDSTETSLMDVYERWLKIKTRAKSTEQAYKLAVEWCGNHLGKPLYVQRMTRNQGDSFRSWLQEPDRAISKKTARDRLTAIKSLLIYAHRDLGLIDKHSWEGLDIRTPRTPTRRRWNDEELQQLFGQPLFQTYETPKGSKGGSDAAYWIPLLGLFTGARIGELAQLRTTDITNEDETPVLRINDENGKRLKTEASRRSIPIHPELIRLGLLDYAEAIRTTGNESLWPILTVNSDRPGLSISNWFGRYRRSAGLTEAYPDFHSFRHLVRTHMSKAKIPDKVQDAITGHETQGSTGTRVYQGVDLEDRLEAIRSLSYKSINLPKVYTSPRMEKTPRRPFRRPPTTP